MNRIVDVANRQIINIEQKDFFQKHVLKNMMMKTVWGSIKRQPLAFIAGLIFLSILFIYRAGFSLGEFIYYFFN